MDCSKIPLTNVVDVLLLVMIADLVMNVVMIFIVAILVVMIIILMFVVMFVIFIVLLKLILVFKPANMAETHKHIENQTFYQLER
jgi:hypothetical protein